MKKQISSDLTLYFTNNFPFSTSTKYFKTYTVILGIGGNIGKVKRNFNKLFLALQHDSRFDIIKTSPLLKNPPFGYLNQNYFLNSLIKLKTNLSPVILLKEMQRYEHRFKRVRTFKDAPRTLDIDIIFIYKNHKKLQIKTPKLTVPHFHWETRDSITMSLKYL